MQPTIARATRSSLRSQSDTTSYVTPRLRTKFGERTFSFSGPAAWNSLPADLRTVSDITDFKNKLKAHLFKLAFDIQWRLLSTYLLFYYYILVFAVIHLAYRLIVLHLCSYISFVIDALEMFYDDDDDELNRNKGPQQNSRNVNSNNAVLFSKARMKRIR